MDSSTSRNKENGLNEFGFAVVTPHETLASGSPSDLSAQAAEPIPLREACSLQPVNRLQDNQLTFTQTVAMHLAQYMIFGTLWKDWDFLTSTGKLRHPPHLTVKTLYLGAMPAQM